MDKIKVMYGLVLLIAILGCGGSKENLKPVGPIQDESVSSSIFRDHKESIKKHYEDRGYEIVSIIRKNGEYKVKYKDSNGKIYTNYYGEFKSYLDDMF